MPHSKTKKMICLMSACLVVGVMAGCNKKTAQPAPNTHTNNTVHQQAASPSPSPASSPSPSASSAPSPAAGEHINIAHQAAQRISQIPSVSSATVLVSRHNAYVAAMMKDRNGPLSRDVENQISQQVKSTDPNIHNVYVSTNPDFVQRVTNYAADVGAGRPVSGFVQEFAEMVRRVFPTAH
ncbi:YhcN/YlaJ family sporulation lipoprotein [Paenibacillus sp. OAS669]|uniref:YhcN/YlaJ family sporulation lipoprotein n=1 Tax=Paenibacillus sp. OAS669 TaxID=2663821 RepID=UPI00178AB443|nr:YhcN/YlaJ family sporulation lipoprotein [Paenibacillus sp. OAS669]MBE1442037.1 YhcN/YlaJ family sporulation lipoprotein [Paenibacillus sp. OAS669]